MDPSTTENLVCDRSSIFSQWWGNGCFIKRVGGDRIDQYFRKQEIDLHSSLYSQRISQWAREQNTKYYQTVDLCCTPSLCEQTFLRHFIFILLSALYCVHVWERVRV